MIRIRFFSESSRLFWAEIAGVMVRKFGSVWGLATSAGLLSTGARAMLVALLAVPLLLLLALVLSQYGLQVAAFFGSSGVYSAYSVAAMLAIAVGLLFFAVVRRKTPFHPVGFLACSLTAAAVLYIGYISSIEVAWVSDFKGMWLHAVDMVASGNYTVRSIYNERALPVLVPAILLFGPNPAVVPFVNVLFLLGIQLAGYDLARRVAGHRAAQGFAVLWIGAMEPILALPITSHDIWGLFFLVLFLWGFRVTFDRLVAGQLSTTRYKWIIAACVVGLAITLTLLDMQRELAPFVILGFGLAGLLLALKGVAGQVRLRPALLLAAGVFLLFGGITTGLKLGGHMLTSAQGETLAQIRIGAYGSSLSNGNYGQGQVIQKTFFNPVDEQARRDLVKAIPLSDLALQPVARIGNIVHRAQRQALLGSQTYFYQTDAKTESAWLLPLTRAYNVCYSIVLAALSLWLILPLLRRLDSLDGLVQLSLLSTLVGLLLLVGESQPRYIFPLWFILPQLVAFALALRQPITDDRLPVTSVWGWDITRGVLLLLAVYLLLALTARWVYDESRGRVLSGWQSALHGALQPPPENWFTMNQGLSAAKIKRDANDPRAGGFGDLALVMKMPTSVEAGGTTSVGKTLCVGDERRALGFFYYMPVQNPKAKGAFTLEVSIDDRRRWSIQSPGNAAITYVRIPDILPAGTCGNLKVNLRANRTISSAPWINASQADLYFMRLVR